MNQITSTVNINDQLSLKITLQPLNEITQEIRNKAKKVYGVIIIDDKLVLIYNSKRDIWGFPGGTIENNESIETALAREMEEEAQLKVLHSQFLGYAWIDNATDDLQLFFVVEGEKIKEFIADPDGGVTENRYININEWDTYLKWKEVGEYLISSAYNYSKK